MTRYQPLLAGSLGVAVGLNSKYLETRAEDGGRIWRGMAVMPRQDAG
jgi:hypothetical protein